MKSKKLDQLMVEVESNSGTCIAFAVPPNSKMEHAVFIKKGDPVLNAFGLAHTMAVDEQFRKIIKTAWQIFEREQRQKNISNE